MTTRPVAPSLRFKGSESLIGSRVCPIERCHSERRAEVEESSVALRVEHSSPAHRTSPSRPQVCWLRRTDLSARSSPPRAPRLRVRSPLKRQQQRTRSRGDAERSSANPSKALTSWMNMDGGRPSISTWRGTARFLASLRSLGMTGTAPRSHLTCRSPSSPCRRTTPCCRTRATDSTRRRCRRATCPPARGGRCSAATPRRCTSP